MYAFVSKLAKLLALLGGTVLSFLIVLTCASIAGRTINSVLHSDLLQIRAPALAETLLASGVGPINGDFELVEAGMAFAIFAFLPLCQLQGSHASVDLFTSQLSARFNRSLRAFTEAVFAAVLVVIAWQLFQGTLSKMSAGTTTFLLEFPLWWAYALSLSGAVVAAFVAVVVAILRLQTALTGHTGPLAEVEAEH